MARARRPASSGMMTISTRVAAGAALRRDRRAIRRGLFHRRHPSASGGRGSRDRRRGDPRASPRIPNASASARRGSTITTITRRPTSPSASFAPRSRWRASSTCRSSSTRARPTTTSPRFCARKWGRAPSRRVLHCFTSSRALAETGLELGLYVSFSGVLTFKNSERLARDRARRPARPGAGRDRRAVSRAGSASRPAQRAGVRRRDRARPRRGRRASTSPRSPPRRAPTRCGCSPRCRPRAARVSLSLTILGCGSSGGVPRVAQGWGACDPNNPRNRRRRCSVLVERAGAEGATQALVDTSPDLREQLIDAGVARLDAVLMTHAHADHTHGIDDLRPIVHGDAASGSTSTWTRRLREALRRKFGYIFETPPGSSYPPIAHERRIRRRRADRRRRAGRADRGDPLRSRARRHRRARLPLRRPRLYARPQRRAGSEPALARRARRLDRRRAALRAAPIALEPRRRAGAGSRGCARAAPC